MTSADPGRPSPTAASSTATPPRRRRPPVIRHLAARPLLGVAIAGFVGAGTALSGLTDWAWRTICLAADLT